jgi:hypothetical protein
MGHPRIAQRGIAWETCTRERWDLDRHFDSCRELWPHVGSWRPCVCRVVRFFLARCKLIRISATLSYMRDTCLLLSFRSNSTFIMLYLCHEMDVDYLVVHEMINIKSCLIRITCLVLVAHL